MRKVPQPGPAPGCALPTRGIRGDHRALLRRERARRRPPRVRRRARPPTKCVAAGGRHANLARSARPKWRHNDRVSAAETRPARPPPPPAPNSDALVWRTQPKPAKHALASAGAHPATWSAVRAEHAGHPTREHVRPPLTLQARRSRRRVGLILSFACTSVMRIARRGWARIGWEGALALRDNPLGSGGGGSNGGGGGEE